MSKIRKHADTQQSQSAGVTSLVFITVSRMRVYPTRHIKYYGKRNSVVC